MKNIFICALITWLYVAQSLNVSAQPAYKEKMFTGGGSIRGTVTFQGDASRIESMQMTKDHASCGNVKRSPRLTVGKNNRLANAVISLEGMTEGKPFPAAAKQTLDQKKCEYVPHVMIVPLGSELDIVNSDPVLHNVHTYEHVPALKTVFNIAQPVKGQRTSIKKERLSRPGILTATCDAGHPWMSAAIQIAEHPYYTLTDKTGSFVLTDIPPGTYTLRLWHEGISVTGKEVEKEKVRKYLFEDPYIMTQKVSVPENGSAEVNFTLTLR